MRGQKRLSTLAEALPLAREIGAGSRAPREIGAGSRGCLSLWRVRSKRDHTPSGIRAVEGVSADARPAFKGTLRQGLSHEENAIHSPQCVSVGKRCKQLETLTSGTLLWPSHGSSLAESVIRLLSLS